MLIISEGNVGMFSNYYSVISLQGIICTRKYLDITEENMKYHGTQYGALQKPPENILLREDNKEFIERGLCKN